MVALGELHVVGIVAAWRRPHRGSCASRARSTLMRLAPEDVGVRVLVDVDDGVGAEVDRVRAGGEGAVVLIRVEHLRGERLPAAGRAAVGEARPALPDAAEAPFDRRDQLLVDGIAVGPEVGRVHRVGVVVVRIGVLDLHDEEARKARRGPLLEEVIGLRLLDAVVAGQVEAPLVVGLEVRIGRGGAEVGDIVRVVPVEDHQRVARLGVLVEVLRAPARGRRGRRRVPRTSTTARS